MSARRPLAASAAALALAASAVLGAAPALAAAPHSGQSSAQQTIAALLEQRSAEEQAPVLDRMPSMGGAGDDRAFFGRFFCRLLGTC